MKRKRKAKTVSATLPLDASKKLAAEVCPLHSGSLADGYELTTKTRLWRRKDGTWTARFVYTRPTEPGTSRTTIIRGLELA